MTKPEILAPAGSLKKAEYAFLYGADAVYAGVPDFSLRVKENLFSLEDIKKGIDLAHSLGKKFYVTINIYAKNKHLEKLPEYIAKIKSLNPDALIISDPGIIAVVKEEWPEAVIHLSTQANCTNWKAAEFWQKQGLERVILAREVSLSEIKEMHEKLPDLEIEAFIQGAMCLAYSGRCVLSAALSKRSANLGDCSQCCRWSYEIVEQKRPGEYMPVEEDQHGTYIMSSKDMCMIEYLDELQEAGVCSLKIEGRNKSVFYLAHIIKAYRQVLDGQWDKEKGLEEIKKVVTRKMHTGFFLDKEAEQDPKLRRGRAPYKFVGEVLEDGSVEVHNEIYLGDEVEVIGPDKEFYFKVEEIIDAKTGEKLESAHGGADQIIKLTSPEELKEKYLLKIKV